MNRLLKTAAALVCAVGLTAFAATSNATATLTDSDGSVWSNATFTATLVSPKGSPTVGGVAVPASQLIVKGTTNGSGTFSAAFVDTSTVDQSGATYTFTIQPNASATPSTVAGVTIAGATPSLSSVVSSGLTAPRFSTGSTAFGYADVEANPYAQGVGATYYNVTTPCLRQYSLAGWTCGGGGGGGAVASVNGHVGTVVLGATDVGAATPASVAAAQAAAIAAAANAANLTSGQVAPSILPVSGPYNCFFFGDSNTAAIGVSNQATAMTYLITADSGCTPVYIGGYSGQYAEFIAGNVITQFVAPPLASLNSTYRQPLVVLAAGTNNGNFCINTSGPTSACETNYTEAMSAMEAWVTIPTASKVMASAATASGTWAVDASAFVNLSVTGTTEKSTTNGNTLTFTVPNSGPKIGVTRIAKDANLGTFTVSIDGSAQTSSCTGTTTFQNYGCSTATLNSTGNEVNAPQREEFAVTSGVSHTVVITVTSPTLSTNIVSILGVDTTPTSGTVGPVVMVSGVPRSGNSGTYPDAALTAIDTTDAAITAIGVADGLNLHFVNVRTPITFANGVTSPAINNTTDMEGNNTTLCPTNGANGLHMDVCGQLHWAQSIEATAINQGVGFAYVSHPQQAPFSASGYSSIASIWYHNQPSGNQGQIFSATKAMSSGDNYFGVSGDSFLSQVGFEYDSIHSKYATTTNYGTSTEAAWKTCPTGYTLISQCTLRAWLDAAGYFYAQSYGQAVGTALASAATITPVAGITHVTGTAAIATITLPAGYSSTVGGCVVLIADGAWTTTTAGNIFAAITAVAGTPYKACYDGSKWYVN